jgi:hypothetical protein
MAKDVRIRFRSFLPGAGFDSAGNPKQGKTRVVGEVDVTNYGGGEGEGLTALDVGLANIDSLHLRVNDEASGDLDANLRSVSYTKSTGHFYLWTIAPDTGIISGVAQAGTETLEFVAEGDSAHDVELL